MRNPFRFMAGTMAALVLGAMSLHANQVTVQELAFDPGIRTTTISVPGFYTGAVYAGINHLLVDGTAMNGFCIDPYHFSSTTSLLYNVVALNQAPKGYMMSAFQASEICKLWGEFYRPDMSTYDAAGMQVAIWEIVAGSQIITGDRFGATNMLASIKTYTGASADLVGLTGPGQDYVVQRTPSLRVPDGGSTLALLGLALATLLAARAIHGRISLAVLGC